jgi:hypothetical protein
LGALGARRYFAAQAAKAQPLTLIVDWFCKITSQAGAAMLAVQGRAMTMAAIEAQGGSVMGEPYMKIEEARKVMRSRIDELEKAVRKDLESL